MRSRLFGLSMMALLLCTLPTLRAQARDDFARTGFHAGGLGVIALPMWEDTLQTESAPLTGVGLSVSGGIDLRGGYRINEHIAAEMGFMWIAPYRITQNGIQVGQASSWMYYVDAKIFVLTGRTQPFVLLGMGAYHLDYVPPAGAATDATAFAPRIGGGVEYYFTESLALTSEVGFVFGTGKLHQRDWMSLSVGLNYRFGSLF